VLGNLRRNLTDQKLAIAQKRDCRFVTGSFESQKKLRR
jgi:hypothetical protein